MFYCIRRCQDGGADDQKVSDRLDKLLQSCESILKTPQKFARSPRPPYYKKKLAQVIFFDQTIRKGPLSTGLLVPTNDLFQIKSDKPFKQVIVTPKSFGFIVEVSFEEEETKPKKPGNGVCCVDVGVNNLMAITSDKHTPILVNGRIIKSVNQHYNKHQNSRKAIEKRYWRIENYLHHASKFVVQNCLRYGIGTIVIGRNVGWKIKPKMSKISSQNFQSIPFLELFEKIRYKATANGIDVVFTEEAYTSKASFLDRDPLPVYEAGVKPKFSGTRIGRGLYMSSGGVLLNADVNGSANIGRKVIQNSGFLTRLDKSLVARPVRINPLKSLSRSNGLGLVDSSNLGVSP